MRVTIIGAGPAGLYSAILIRRARPDTVVCIHEQNPPDATFGFGVVFSDQALSFLRTDDPETASLIEPHMMRWSDITVAHLGENIRIDGVGFSAIGRLELLYLLQQRAREFGVEPVYGQTISDPAELGECDLLIGADGVNSVVRNTTMNDFGASINNLGNWFVWYGAECGFETLTQTFVDTVHGPMTAHHYPYAPGRSTFIVEMTGETFAAAGLAQMTEQEYRIRCETWFTATLGDAKLVPNNSIWRRFPDLSCARWHVGNRVLVGDALHTAHFSIGSGTRLALEDVVALVDALRSQEWKIGPALREYQEKRQPILRKFTTAAALSAAWYEGFGKYMALDPNRFALSYIRRAGRIDADRLRALCPNFVGALEGCGIAWKEIE